MKRREKNYRFLYIIKITSTEKKYTILQTIFKEQNIVCLFGDDEDYFETLDTWFNNSL